MNFKDAFLDAISSTLFIVLYTLGTLIVISGVILLIGSPIMLILSMSSVIPWIIPWGWLLAFIFLGYFIIVAGLTIINYIS